MSMSRPLLLFPIIVVLAFAAALTPKFVKNGFDPSVFIMASENHVDSSRTIAPIIIQKGDGYDGQFYYRFALAPFDVSQPGYGITLDDPPWRMQRILYPVLAWLVSAGQPRFTAWAMLLVNLLGLGAIGYFAIRLSRRFQSAPITPLLVVLWPGFWIALNRDTTEIVAVAFLLAAIEAYTARRTWLYAVLAVLTVLTRETSIFVFAGIFCAELLQRKSVRHLATLALPIVLYAAWRSFLTHLWGQPVTISSNLTWPLLGIYQAVSAAFVEPKLANALYAVAGIGFIVVFSGVVAEANLGRWREPLVMGWILLLGLMSVLSGRTGPWVEPIAYFRAFSECYVVGLFLLPRDVAGRAGKLAAVFLGIMSIAITKIA
jgi:hypothetical protein